MHEIGSEARSKNPSENEEKPLVSIGIFAYNHQSFIAEAVRSAINQSYRNLEIFVVDDGSSDKTSQEIERASATDPRVITVSDGKNRGLIARMNQVLGMARGSWITVLGGDDMYLVDAVENMMRIQTNQTDVVWGDLIVIDEAGSPSGYARPRDTWQGPTARRYENPASPLKDLFRVNNFISGTTPMMRTQTLRAVGGYTEGVLNEDLDMWLRLAPDHLFQYVNKPVGRYRVVHGSSSRSEARMTLDQAKIFKRLATDPRYSRKGLARLLAMRWVLSFARTYGKPPVSLAELGEESELGKGSLVRQLLPAAVTPVWGSAVAWIRRVIGTNLSVLDRGDNGAPQPSDSDMRKRSD